MPDTQQFKTNAHVLSQFYICTKHVFRFEMFATSVLVGFLIPSWIVIGATPEVIEQTEQSTTNSCQYVEEIRVSLGRLADRVAGIEGILAAHTAKGERKLGNIEERLGVLSNTAIGIKEVLEAHVGKGEQKLVKIQQKFAQQTSEIDEKLHDQTSAITEKLDRILNSLG